MNTQGNDTTDPRGEAAPPETAAPEPEEAAYDIEMVYRYLD